MALPIVSIQLAKTQVIKEEYVTDIKTKCMLRWDAAITYLFMNNLFVQFMIFDCLIFDINGFQFDEIVLFLLTRQMQSDIFVFLCYLKK